MAVYITINAEEKLNLIVTPNLIAVMNIIVNEFHQANSGIPIVLPNIKKLNLHNAIGHESRIELLAMEDVSV